MRVLRVSSCTMLIVNKYILIKQRGGQILAGKVYLLEYFKINTYIIRRAA